MGKKKIMVLIAVGLFFLTGCNKTENKDISTEVDYSTEQLEVKELEEADVGDVIQLGHLEQDGDPSTVDEPVFWDVLDKKDNALLVISHYVIAREQFSDNRENTTWENSQIREFLNGQFYDELFSDKEKDIIIDSVISNPSSIQYLIDLDKDDKDEVTRDMPDTTDKLFLLSWEEVVTYFHMEIKVNIWLVKYYGSASSVAKPSYVVMMEDYENRKKINEKNGWGDVKTVYNTNGLDWVLRSSWSGDEYMLTVNKKGHIVAITPTRVFGIRPAMWIQVN